MTVPAMPVDHGSAPPVHLERSGRVLLLGWWSIYLLLSPFYVFASGTPQPADLFLVALSPIVLILLSFRFHVYRDILLTALAFLMWVALVNGFWWAKYYSSEFLVSTLFYVYNAFVLFSMIVMHRLLGQQFIITTRIALMAIIAVQLAALVLGSDGDGLRQQGTFTNPNQLGYWSLLIGCCVVALRGRDRLTVSDLIALLAAGFIAAESLSRAATYAFVVLVAIAIACQRVSRRGLILILAGGAVLPMLWAANPSLLPDLSEISVVERFNKRLEFREDQDTLGGERGYERLFHYPEHLILGAGEGKHERFAITGAAYELHSSFGTLLFHYGAVGTALFGLFLVTCLRQAYWGHILLLVPIGLYGLTHQGLRFTLFWIFLGLVVAMSGRARQGDVGAAQRRPVTWLTSGREGMLGRGS